MVDEKHLGRRSASAVVRWRRSAASPGAAIGLLAFVLAAPAHADGGTVQLSQTSGPFLVTVLTAPTPLRAGLIDVSVLVQDGDSRAPLLDAALAVTLRPVDASAPSREAPATHAAATNKLFYAALLDVPTAGRWTIDVSIAAGTRATSVSCVVDVAPPLAPAARYWPYLILPFAAIALYALHQWLRGAVNG